MTAKDKDTGKEQTVTISGSTNLDKSEVERMIKEAEEHAAEDKRRKEEIEARNQADSLAYQLERTLKDLGDKVPVHEKARCEQLIADTKQAIKEEAPIDRIRQLTSDLQQALQMVASAAYQQTAQAGPETGAGDSASQSGKGGDDVIDAEFTEK